MRRFVSTYPHTHPHTPTPTHPPIHTHTHKHHTQGRGGHLEQLHGGADPAEAGLHQAIQDAQDRPGCVDRPRVCMCMCTACGFLWSACSPFPDGNHLPAYPHARTNPQPPGLIRGSATLVLPAPVPTLGGPPRAHLEEAGPAPAAAVPINATRPASFMYMSVCVESIVERDIESIVEKKVESIVERDVESIVERKVESIVERDVERSGTKTERSKKLGNRSEMSTNLLLLWCNRCV
jgi:hypothetical protein